MATDAPPYTPATAVLFAMKTLRSTNPDPKVLARIAEIEAEYQCHCGRPVAYGFDGNPEHHRGMCDDCDLARCDAYPLECPHRRARA